MKTNEVNILGFFSIPRSFLIVLFSSLDPLNDEEQENTGNDSRVGNIKGVPMIPANVEIEKVHDPSMQDPVQEISQCAS